MTGFGEDPSPSRLPILDGRGTIPGPGVGRPLSDWRRWTGGRDEGVVATVPPLALEDVLAFGDTEDPVGADGGSELLSTGVVPGALRDAPRRRLDVALGGMAKRENLNTRPLILNTVI